MKETEKRAFSVRQPWSLRLFSIHFTSTKGRGGGCDGVRGGGGEWSLAGGLPASRAEYALQLSQHLTLHDPAPLSTPLQYPPCPCSSPPATFAPLPHLSLHSIHCSPAHPPTPSITSLNCNTLATHLDILPSSPAL